MQREEESSLHSRHALGRRFLLRSQKMITKSCITLFWVQIVRFMNDSNQSKSVKPKLIWIGLLFQFWFGSVLLNYIWFKYFHSVVLMSIFLSKMKRDGES